MEQRKHSLLLNLRIFHFRSLGRREFGWPPRSRSILQAFNTPLRDESTQPPAHGLANHSQMLGNLLHRVSPRIQQQHLRALQQPRRQGATSRKTPQIILLLLGQQYLAGTSHVILQPGCSYGANLYPDPLTVRICFGNCGLLSSFCLSQATCTSTVRVETSG